MKEHKEVCFYESLVSLHQENALEGITMILDANESWEKLPSGDSLNGHSLCKQTALLAAPFSKPSFNSHANSVF